jgi:hypothetical protein
MQRRSTPSIAPPSSNYPIPHSQIAFPPCIPCTTSSTFSQKKIRSAALINKRGGWILSWSAIMAFTQNAQPQDFCSVTLCSVTVLQKVWKLIIF